MMELIALHTKIFLHSASVRVGDVGLVEIFHKLGNTAVIQDPPVDFCDKPAFFWSLVKRTPEDCGRFLSLRLICRPCFPYGATVNIVIHSRGIIAKLEVGLARHHTVGDGVLLTQDMDVQAVSTWS